MMAHDLAVVDNERKLNEALNLRKQSYVQTPLAAERLPPAQRLSSAAQRTSFSLAVKMRISGNPYGPVSYQASEAIHPDQFATPDAFSR
jgi:hypothetical protein